MDKEKILKFFFRLIFWFIIWWFFKWLFNYFYLTTDPSLPTTGIFNLIKISIPFIEFKFIDIGFNIISIDIILFDKTSKETKQKIKIPIKKRQDETKEISFRLIYIAVIVFVLFVIYFLIRLLYFEVIEPVLLFPEYVQALIIISVVYVLVIIFVFIRFKPEKKEDIILTFFWLPAAVLYIFILLPIQYINDKIENKYKPQEVFENRKEETEEGIY